MWKNISLLIICIFAVISLTACGKQDISALVALAQLDSVNETALLEVSAQCVELDYESQFDIDNALSENPATTDVVMEELTNSEFTSISLIAYQWLASK